MLLSDFSMTTIAFYFITVPIAGANKSAEARVAIIFDKRYQLLLSFSDILLTNNR